MKNDIKELEKKFIKIKKRGWIKSLRKGTTGIGYTFETLIGKKEDKESKPDFKSIEIKVKRRFSKGIITLFNAAPNSEKGIVDKIYERYAIPNKNKNNLKTLMICVETKRYYKYGDYFFKIKNDTINKKIILEIIDSEKNRIENNIWWSYDLLEEKLKSKMKYLAIVKALVKKEKEELYYYYYKINYYEIKDFKYFIKAIENGKIKLTFKFNVYMDGDKKGKLDYHGIGFDIHEEDIEEIYKKKE